MWFFFYSNDCSDVLTIVLYPPSTDDLSVRYIKSVLTTHFNFCKDHRYEIEVPDPLTVQDLDS